MKIREFIKECHQKEVFKNLSIYLVSGWVLIQVFSEIREPFGLPKISMTYLLLVLIAGFPFYAYLIWRYRLKPAEAESTRNSDMKVVPGDNSPKGGKKGPEELRKHLPGIRFYSPFQSMYFTFLFIVLFFSVVSVAWIVNANFINEPDPGAFAFVTEEENDKIAVLSFENNTSRADLDVVGKMAVDWIIHGITQNEMGQVISPKVLEQYSTVMKASLISDRDTRILTEYLKPGKVITGNYYLSNGELLIQCSIMDGNMNETLETLEPVTCDPGNPLTCIEQLKQRLLSSLLEDDANYTLYEEKPPNYDAYKLMLSADQYGDKDPEYLRILNEAIALDSTYFEPKLHRLTYYYNIDEFGIADSLVQELLYANIKNSRQKNQVKLWSALIRGDNKKAFIYQKNEYNAQPDDLNNNSSAMVVALQFVNRPEIVDSIYNTQLAMEKIDSLSCLTCEYRMYSKGMADIALGNPDKPIDMFREYGSVKDFYWVKDVLLYAYVRTGDLDAIEEILSTTRLTGDLQIWREKCLLVGKQYLIQANKDRAVYFLDQLIKSLEQKSGELTNEEKEELAYAHFYKGEYSPAADLFKDLYNKDPENIEVNTFLAMSLLKDDKTGEADTVMAGLERLREDYQYGAIDYARARYYALKGDEDLLIQNLIRAVAGGKRYTPGSYLDDVLMQPYISLEGFQNVLTFWH